MTDVAEALFDELIGDITFNIRNRPRETQTWIGPSEVGDPCDRSLINRVMEVPARLEPPNWKATVGTAVHEHLETMFRDEMVAHFAGPRYMCEVTVTVGTIGGRPVVGHVDVYDRLTCCVVDWKTKSKWQMTHHRRYGAGPKYEVQAQLYGTGIAALGLPVSQVCDIFLPRDGELADAFHWAADYDPQVGIDALARANRLYTLAQTFGVKTALQQFPACDSEWCRTCADPNKIRPGRARISTADNPFALAF